MDSPTEPAGNEDPLQIPWYLLDFNDDADHSGTPFRLTNLTSSEVKVFRWYPYPEKTAYEGPFRQTFPAELDDQGPYSIEWGIPAGRSVSVNAERGQFYVAYHNDGRREPLPFSAAGKAVPRFYYSFDGDSDCFPEQICIRDPLEDSVNGVSASLRTLKEIATARVLGLLETGGVDAGIDGLPLPNHVAEQLKSASAFSGYHGAKAFIRKVALPERRPELSAIERRNILFGNIQYV